MSKGLAHRPNRYGGRGVDRAYVSRIERALANPTIDVLERIASVLEVEMAELFRVPQPN